MPVIRMEIARAGLNASGTSETFLNLLLVLRDARAWGTGGSDQPRFADSTLRYLERTLTSRSADLRDAVFQVVHLMALAARVSPSGRALDVVYGFDGVVRARVLARYFGERLPGAKRVHGEAQAIVVGYREGQSYRLAHARLPLLIALTEFLLDAPDNPEEAAAVMERIAEVEAAPDSFETVRTVSNAIAAGLGRRLDGLLRGRAERERFETLAAYLDRSAEGDSEAKRWVIDDAAVLDFWLQSVEAPERGTDFRQFKSVHRAFVALVLALRAGDDWEQLYNARAIDDADSMLQIPDRSGVQPAFVFDEDRPTALDDLHAPPIDRVKFLTGSEEKALEPLVRLWGEVRQFPLSMLRSEVFGGAQNEITNALRFGRPIEGLVALEQFGAEDGPESATESATDAYAIQRARYDKLAGHLKRCLHAAAHVVAERRGLNLPEREAETARRAHRSLRRAGFSEAFAENGTGEAFEAAIEPLSALSSQVAALLAALPEATVAQFSADRRSFASAFATLYAKDE